MEKIKGTKTGNFTLMIGSFKSLSQQLVDLKQKFKNI